MLARRYAAAGLLMVMAVAVLGGSPAPASARGEPLVLAAAGSSPGNYGGGSSNSSGSSSSSDYSNSYSNGYYSGDSFSFRWMVMIWSGILAVVLGSVVFYWLRYRWRIRRRRHRVCLAAQADGDPLLTPQQVEEQAAQLFVAVQQAWSDGDRQRLAEHVEEHLLTLWGRKLDDFERKGWRSRVSVHWRPRVSYVNFRPAQSFCTARALVLVEAWVTDYVDTGTKKLRQKGHRSKRYRLREYWTLGVRDGAWILFRIEPPGFDQLGRPFGTW